MHVGVDRIISDSEYHHLKKYNLALVTNDAARTLNGTRNRVALLEAGFQLKKIFSPEHGISAQGIDGAKQPHSIDPFTQLPIISLYHSSFKPTDSDLSDIDYILFDIQDIGCRFYTYLWTMTYVMEACAATNKKFILLDRPNPIGIDISQVEGPMLDVQNCSSFLGRWSIPIKHSCTLGELATYFKATYLPTLELNIIKVDLYSRINPHILYKTWYAPSPAIRSQAAAMIYPGLGLLEGVNIQEGRGTHSPFTLFGAPFINAYKLIESWTFDCTSLSFSPIEFIPTEGHFQNKLCYGLEFHFKDKILSKPVALGIYIIQLIHKLYPQHLSKRLYKTLANPTGENHLDRLFGLKNSYECIVENKEIPIDCSKEWANRMNSYLLY